jgi:uncharacterized protein YegP (UPF0339 family)
MIFEIRPARNDQWYFRIMSGANTLATSETYVRKSDARHAVELIINRAAGGQIVEY